MSEEAPQPPRERAGCSLGVAFGLLVLVGLVSTMVAQKTRAADGQQLLEDWFEPSTLPFGFEVLGATVEMRGEQAILFTRPDAPEEAAKAEPPKRKDSDDVDSDETFDWSAIPTGEEGTPPFELAVIGYPAQLAQSALDDLFGFSGGDDDGEVEITDVSSEGGSVIMERGRLNWGAYTTLFVHERELEWGGTFRDVVRVNLSLPGQSRVLFARWPRGFPGSMERVAEVLAALVPRGLDEPEPAADRPSDS